MKKVSSIIFFLISLNAFAYLDPNALKICNEHRYQSDKEACMASIMDKKFSAAGVSICNQHRYVTEKQGCLLVIGDKFLDQGALGICNQHRYVSDKEACMKAISDLTFDRAGVAICNDNRYVSDKQACLIRIGRPISTNPTTPRKRIIKILKNAIEFIKDGSRADAISLIKRAITKIRNL